MNEHDGLILLYLIDVLKKYSDQDEKHRLIQTEIEDILKRKYRINVDRKTIKDNMRKIIRYTERMRNNMIYYDESSYTYTDKKEDEKITVPVYKNFGYNHHFSHAELRLIIDSILFSKRIPNKERKNLIKKLENLTSKHFNSRVNYITSTEDNYPKNDEIFANIAILDEAIRKSVQVSFNYYDYEIDERLNLAFRPRKNSEGMIREYTINPYQMIAADGRYYLICNHDKYDTMANYRVDRIKNMKLLETKRKPLREIKGYERNLDLNKYIDEHIYMFSGESERVAVRLKKYALNEFIEFFNPEKIIFSNQTEEEVTARVKVNRTAMRNWALRYALHAKVISPEDLVEDIKSDIEHAWKNYQ